MEFMETSAKTSYNIGETFNKVAQNLLTRINNGEISLENCPPGIKVGSTTTKSLESHKEKSVKNKKQCC